MATDGSSVNAIAITLAIAAVANPLDPAPVCLANFLNSMGWLQRNRVELNIGITDNCDNSAHVAYVWDKARSRLSAWQRYRTQLQ